MSSPNHRYNWSACSRFTDSTGRSAIFFDGRTFTQAPMNPTSSSQA